MKKLFIISLLAVAVFASCQKQETPEKKGVELTISATITNPGEAAVKSTYTYNSGTPGTITTEWEASEAITIVSIGDSGITAVDNFTSTGVAGRTKAEFSGTWNGNAGDKVICLYPAITSYGSSLFSGVTVGSSSITLNNLFSNITKLSANSTEDLKKSDVLVGDVTIDGGNASVELNRQISVLKIDVTASSIDCYYGAWEYLESITFSAKNNTDDYAVFATQGTLAVTKSTYTGSFVPTVFGATTFSIPSIQNESNTYSYYIPIFVKDELANGYKLYFTGDSTGKSSSTDPRGPWQSYQRSKTISSTIHILPGYFYHLSGIVF